MVNWFCNFSLRVVNISVVLKVLFLDHSFSHALPDFSLLLSFFSVLADISLLLRWVISGMYYCSLFPSLHNRKQYHAARFLHSFEFFLTVHDSAYFLNCCLMLHHIEQPTDKRQCESHRMAVG